jgi:ribonuclease HI
MRPLGTKPDQNINTVSELLLDNGIGWDVEKLNECFFEVDVNDILKIPVGRARTANYLAWNYTKNGVFSVRSAYHLKRKLKKCAAGIAEASLSTTGHHGWLALWNAVVANKIKVHCWRLVQNGLAVGSDLGRRKIKEGIRCIACNHEETLAHRFWHYQHSVQVWNYIRSSVLATLMMPPVDLRSHRELQAWVPEWFNSLQAKDLGLVMTTLYHIWLSRNGSHDEPMIEDPERTARRVLAITEEWGKLRDPSPNQAPKVVEHWRPPERGWFKANADGAFSATDGQGGGGVILRDDEGVPIEVASFFFMQVTEPERAELLPCRQAVRVSKEYDVRKLVLESDCAGAVNKLRAQDLDRSVHGPLVEEIKTLLREFEDVVICQVRQSGNEVAHRLAKEGCKNKCNSSWSGTFPDCVLDLLAREAGI